MIGLVSCIEVYNYGSQLMSLALQMMVDELGYPCEHIRYIPKKDLHYLCSIPSKLTNRALADHKRELNQKRELANHDPKQKALIQKKKQAFDRFIHEYMKVSKPAVGYRELKRLSEHYDRILLGSDQVWHPLNLEGDFKNLMFVPERIPRVAYGASFGVNKIPKGQIKRTKRYLSRIPFISVREDQGAELIEKLMGERTPVVLDPTLMITMKQWEKILSDTLVPKEPYIFVYFLGDNPENRRKVMQLKRETGKKVAAIDLCNSEKVDYVDWHVDSAGPGDFVSLIRGADFVCTDSFHGTVFSILNQKQFITFLRYSGGKTNAGNSRISTLLGQLGLLDRIYIEGDLIQQMREYVDYAGVNQKLDAMREQSWKFLKRALEGSSL